MTQYVRGTQSVRDTYNWLKSHMSCRHTTRQGGTCQNAPVLISIAQRNMFVVPSQFVKEISDHIIHFQPPYCWTASACVCVSLSLSTYMWVTDWRRTESSERHRSSLTHMHVCACVCISLSLSLASSLSLSLSLFLIQLEEDWVIWEALLITHTQAYITPHTWLSHVTRVNESRHKCE